MLKTIKDMLGDYNIYHSAPIRLSDCEIKRPYLLEKNGLSKDGSAVLFVIPYYTTFCDDPSRNISAYAVSKDYHIFCEILRQELIPRLKERFPENNFSLFADHSPINETVAAARCGLGVIGKNHLLITEEYSSYIFLAEIVTDARLVTSIGKVKYCIDCGRCKNACPSLPENEFCMSALTQKKGELTEDEIDSIKQYGIAWGCDRCQECCPYTKKAKESKSIYSKIEYFNKDCIPSITYSLIDSMSDDEFNSRAYSWRKRDTILRNLSILYSDKEH